MKFIQRKNLAGTRTTFYYDLGRGKGQRPTTGIFKFCSPKDQAERNHNKEAQRQLEILKSHAILEKQAIGSGIIPAHKFKPNFLDYYEEFVRANKRPGNRHLEGSYSHFRSFVKVDFIPPVDITENFCTRYRQYLLDRLRGDTPANYFARFKKVLKAATKEGYYRVNPVDDVKAKSGKRTKPKENLESEEYIRLINTPFYNREVRDAFIFSCYTGLRYCDVSGLCWSDITGKQLRTQIIQAKTGEALYITMHSIALQVISERKQLISVNARKVFRLPGNNHCNEMLAQWCRMAGITKHITWHCARLSFSILLQDAQVDAATVALLLGHTTAKYVNETYKRHRPKNQLESINRLPNVSTI